MISMFAGRRLVIATKHKKEKVLAPVIEKSLGVRSFVDERLDTDSFGTFSGEIERTHDSLATARLKCLKAMELTNCDLAVASEGSFGTHPMIFFGCADEEILVFLDRKNNLEITVQKLSLETNLNGAEITTEKELFTFSKRAQFPSHALIIRRNSHDGKEVIKGITNYETLRASFCYFIKKYGSCYVETDMRAMHNPSRMKVIESAACKLVAKINTQCPKCHIPGFGITSAKKGLPCGNCGLKTKSILSHVYSCQKCFFKKEEFYPDDKKNEEPQFCDFCNP
jgi:hypothetical protein